MRITQEDDPDGRVWPALLERDIILSYEPAARSSANSEILNHSGRIISKSSAKGNGGEPKSGEGLDGDYGGGMVWRVEPFADKTSDMNWTIFPSMGKLRPGQK